ncbi:MAG: metallophosphoesterase [Muribaculaceae bacterium]|nr:metallophosphoesterase [Muribaculaceae bacterium]
MKIIVLPDVHGRKFWEVAREHINECDRVVFVGDYFDPYDFEEVSVVYAINNFREILSFAREYPEKVVMLLGNHDMPYFSEDYRALSSYHCRWSPEWHSKIAAILAANRELFKMAHVEDDILFTHAGCSTKWLKSIHAEPASLDELVATLNALPTTEKGLRQLFMVSHHRGGRNKAGSCIWADVDELAYASMDLHIDGKAVKQVFGHTLQVEYDRRGNLVSCPPITNPTMKMLDTRCAYLLDTETFEHTALLNA